MVEKPLATSIAESEAMVAAARQSGAFLMTAYRLHNEPATHAMLDAVRSGKIGEALYFAATFGFQTQLGNHRLKAGHWGGALPDVGIYCLNAARHVFAAEPIAVQAMSSRPPNDLRFTEVDASLALTLKFPGERLSHFFCSFGSALSETIRVVGCRGELILDPAFRFESAVQMRLHQGEDETIHRYPQVDHFAGQIAYFSDCIVGNTAPEADGEEGVSDMIMNEKKLYRIANSARNVTASIVIAPHLSPRPAHYQGSPRQSPHSAAHGVRV
jgi:predicted dehydrogenase